MQKEILHFWFEELSPAQWWRVDLELDQRIKMRFSEVHQSAAAGELFEWRASPLGRLAEVIILDQFSRNMFRGTAHAFVFDPIALVLAQEGVRVGADLALNSQQRAFFYLPYMHSESSKIHHQAEVLFRTLGAENNYDFELRHKAIIERFGRYPHRNKILNRISTAEEEEFLLQPGSSF